MHLRNRTSRLLASQGAPARRSHVCLVRLQLRQTYTLVLLRHGESEWNAKNLFTGWVDVDLTDKGAPRPSAAASCCARPACCPTSCTPRCCAGRSHRKPRARRRRPALDPGAPVWRLNERHYGALQGKDKKQTLEEYGEEQFMLWRRSYDVPPPPLDDDDEFSRSATRVRRPRRRAAAHRVPQGRRRADAALLGDAIVPDLRPADGARRRARQQPARAGQAPRRHQRRGHRRAEHPDRHAAGLRARRRPAPTVPAASTSTPRPPPPPPPPSPTRAADPPRRLTGDSRASERSRPERAPQVQRRER
jgi:broad specificity phosphatase PhoE